MQKFNTTDLLTGYIKQLLHEFNLPKIRVYTKQHAEYHKKALENNNLDPALRPADWALMPKESIEILETITKKEDDGSKDFVEFPNTIRYIPYIKDNKIQEYINGEWVEVGKRNSIVGPHFHNYTYNSKILNYTKNLKINNNVYDSYTHEYLGDYLRFQRDYNDINLMPLYNCFSNRLCESLKLDYEIIKTLKKDDMTNETVKTKVSFDTSDSRYKIYMVPVKLFQTYTIAIDSDQPFEVCCGIYGAHQDKRKRLETIPALTYKKYSGSNFSQPILYEEILKLNQYTIGNAAMELAQNECDLKLFIKLPINNNSTIIILEGNYLNWNDSCYIKMPRKVIELIDTTDEPKSVPTVQGIEQEGDYFFNIADKVLYQFNNGAWTNQGFLWNSFITAELEYSSSKEFICKPTIDDELIIDEKTYKAPNHEDWFEAYVTTNGLSKINDNAVYFNSTANFLIINPLNQWKRITNTSVININLLSDELDFRLITPLQLLRINTRKQHPFADRLIEYLFENAITSDNNEITLNIKRVQKVLEENYKSNNYISTYPGVWDFKINKITYDYINQHQNTFATNHDILGFIDKDVEKYYAYKGKTAKDSVSIMNVELDREDY